MIKIIIFICLLSSCAGYKFQSINTIFSIHEVNRLVIPFFKNSTPFHDIGKHFTNSVYMEMSKFKDLELDTDLTGMPGEAILIGNLISGKRKKDVISSTARKFISVNSGYRPSIGERPSFYVNSQNTYSLYLEIIIIKAPLIESKANLATSEPEVIFKEVFPVNFNFSNSLQSGNDIDGKTAANYTMNKSIEKLAFERVSKEVAFNIKRALGR